MGLNRGHRLRVTVSGTAAALDEGEPFFQGRSERSARLLAAFLAAGFIVKRTRTTGRHLCGCGPSGEIPIVHEFAAYADTSC
jgi:hypothetical protein